MKLTDREFRMLSLLYPSGTLAAGQSASESLRHRGFLSVTQDGRLTLSRKGIIAVTAKQKTEALK